MYHICRNFAAYKGNGRGRRRTPLDVPEYTFDVHTRKGRKMGRTKEQFFHEEHEALTPRVPGLFDNLVP